jgi:HK97 family phage portal protein
MTPLAKLKNLFAQKANGPASVRSHLPLAAYFDTTGLRSGSAGYDGLAREGYLRNPVVRRAVRLISDGAASVTWTARENGVRVDDHPALALLAHPNPQCAGAAFLETLAGYLALHGNAYVELVENMDGAPAELYALRPDRVRVAQSDSGWPAEYIYQTGAQGAHFAVDALSGRSELLHLKQFHPLDDHYGAGGLDAAADAIHAHNAATRWNVGLLENAARPSGALVFDPKDGPPSLSAEQFNRLKTEMAEQFQGMHNAGRPMLLEGGLKWQSLSLTPADMDFTGCRDSAARDIAMAFGVPPMLLGILGDATYANYQEANRAFWRLTLMPMMMRLAGGITGWLRKYWPDLTLDIDRDALPALAADREILWRQVSAADFLTADERRLVLGLPVAARLPEILTD